MNSRFKKGDRVVALGNVDEVDLAGMTGVVIKTDSIGQLCIEFDQEFEAGHNADGAGRPRHCRWTRKEDRIALLDEVRGEIPECDDTECIEEFLMEFSINH